MNYVNMMGFQGDCGDMQVSVEDVEAGVIRLLWNDDAEEATSVTYFTTEEAQFLVDALRVLIDSIEDAADEAAE